MELIIRDPTINIIVSGNTDSLAMTTDFKSELDSGKLKLKKGKIHTLKEHSIIFEDGSEENVDAIILATGFEFCYQNLFDEEYYWPLFCAFFSIKDPTICFNGVPDGPFQFFLSEKNPMVLKHVITGATSLPSKEKMMESF